MLPIIYSVFPLEYTRYIEVFGGSAAVLLGKPKDKFEVYNDLDAELVNLIRCIKYRSAELLLELDFLPINSREEFEEWNRFCRGEGDYAAKHLSTQLEIIDKMIPKEMGAELKASMRSRVENLEVRQAAAYFLRTRHSYASSGRSFACQPFNIRTTFQQIAEMSIRIQDLIIENQSFEILIPHYDREDSFFYLDPPYYNSEYVYDADFDWEQHVQMRDILADCKGKWLVSQADFPEIRDLYKEYCILDFKRIHSMAQRARPGSQFGELLIGNYDLLERERTKPEQISLTEMMGQPIDVTQNLKERIIPCKNRST